MRKIRFRGKSVYDGELYGGVGIFVDPNIKTERLFEQVDQCVPYTQRAYIYSPFDEKFEVDLNTVGQYTGYKDIHKNNIYEGDIVSCKFDDNIKYIGEVKFGEFRNDIIGLDNKRPHYCGWYLETKEWVIIEPENIGFQTDKIYQTSQYENFLEIIEQYPVEIIGNVFNGYDDGLRYENQFTK